MIFFNLNNTESKNNYNNENPIFPLSNPSVPIPSLEL